MHATSATGNRGFTLLELLVVLSIILLLACAWPLASARVFVTQRLRNESQQLVAAVRFGQLTARTSGTPLQLSIAESGNTYVVGNEPHELPAGLTLEYRADPGAAAPTHLILFPDGSSNGGTLALTLREHTLALRVLPLTGRLELLP